MYDIDSFKEVDNLEKQDLIGSVEASLHEIVCAPGQLIIRQIENKK